MSWITLPKTSLELTNTGRISPDGVERIASAIHFTPDDLWRRFSAYQRYVFSDGVQCDVAIPLAYVALRRSPLGVVKLQFGGRCELPPRQTILSYQWVGYGFALDGREIGYLEYESPKPSRPAPVESDWDVWLPLHDMPALRQALRSSAADVQGRSVGVCVFMDAAHYPCPVRVAFDTPVALFSSVGFSAIKCVVTVPPEAADAASRSPLGAVGLQLDGRPVAMIPLVPPLALVAGNEVVFSLDT